MLLNSDTQCSAVNHVPSTRTMGTGRKSVSAHQVQSAIPKPSLGVFHTEVVPDVWHQAQVWCQKHARTERGKDLRNLIKYIGKVYNSVPRPVMQMRAHTRSVSFADSIAH